MPSGAHGCALYLLLAKKALASQHVLDVAFGNAPRNAILPDFSLRRGSAREARRYAQDDCHALGWDAPSQDKSLGFAIS